MESTRHVYLPDSCLPAAITSIRVVKDQELRKGDVICIYEHTAPEVADIDGPVPKDAPKVLRRDILYSSYEGKIGSVDSKPGQRITSPMVPIITVIEPCGHDIQYNGLCTLCGKDLTISDYYEDVTKRATINMSHDATGIRVSVDEAQKMEKKNAQRLRKLKKLSLIIDLDQTIVHAYASQDPKFEDWLIDNYTGPDADTPREKRQLPSDIGAFFLPDSPHKYFIKLRPGLREFLDRVSALYELHIYTMGTRHYAEAVARVIDPDGRFFRERILSRDESGSLTQKSIRRLFPCDQSMVVMLDDRADVWQWSPNLIKILPYAFFTGVGDINSGHLPANSTAVHKAMQEKKDEQAAEQGGDRGSKLVDNDCELKVVGGVLESIHETYYEEYESRKMFDEFKSGSELEEEEEDGGETSEDLPDVTNILPIMKNAVLQDCRFVFSAVIPINPGMPPPHRSDIWRWATEFGAECQLEIDDSTTHVVAGKPGTEKVHQARRLNLRDPKRKNSPINIVPVSWLLNSISRWSRLDEGPYLMYPNEEHRQRKTGENGKAEDIDDIPTTDTEQPPKEVLERVESFVVHGTSGQPELAESGENNENEAQGAESSGSAAVQAVRRVGDSRRDTDIELEKQEREIQEHSKDARERLNSIDWDEEDKVFMEMMRASDSEAGSVVESSREQTRQSPTLAVRRQRADDDYSNSSDMNDSRQATITRRPGVTKRRRVVDDGSDTSTPLFGGSRLHEDEDQDNNDVVVGSGKSVGSTILSQLRKGGGAIDLDTSDTDENSDVEEGYQEDTEGDDDDHDDNDHDDDEDEEEVQQFSDDDESDGEVEEEGTSGGEFDDLINQLGGKLEDESG